MTEMVLPQFGMGMADGTIIAWHKAVGDTVSQGEALCDVEAAKTTVEVSAPCDGILQAILVPAGTNVPVNSVLAIIGDTAPAAGSAEPAAAASSSSPAPDPEPTLAPTPSAAPPPPSAPLARTSEPRDDRLGHGPQVEPRARRAARDRGLDLALIGGSGPGGRIIEEDVLRAGQTGAAVPASAAPAFAPAAGAGIGAVVHQLRMRCDAAPLASLLDGIAQAQGTGITVMAVLVRASALAMADAGLENRSIGVRSPGDGLQAIGDPAALTARAIDAVIAAGGEASVPAPALVLEHLPDEWLDEVIRIDAAGAPSLSASAFPPGGDETWQFTLTFAGGAMDCAVARRFLAGLRQLLGRPLAILV